MRPSAKLTPEQGRRVVHRGAGVLGAGGELRVDVAVADALVAVLKVEHRRVQVGDRGLGRLAGCAAEVDQRVQLLYGGQPPVGVAGELEVGGACLGLGEGHLLAGILLPHQPGPEVGHGPVSVVDQAEGLPLILPVLAPKAGRRRLGARDLRRLAEAPVLPRVDNRERRRRRLLRVGPGVAGGPARVRGDAAVASGVAVRCARVRSGCRGLGGSRAPRKQGHRGRPHGQGPGSCPSSLAHAPSSEGPTPVRSCIRRTSPAGCGYTPQHAVQRTALATGPSEGVRDPHRSARSARHATRSRVALTAPRPWATLR